jgi:hypothetical protein
VSGEQNSKVKRVAMLLTEDRRGVGVLPNGDSVLALRTL